MPLFRAIAKPQRVEEGISLAEWASGLILNLQPELDPVARPTPVEIEPPGVAIDLDRDTVLGQAARTLAVQVIARRAQQLPAGHVAN